MPDVITFDDGNARTYRKTAVTRAHRVDCAAVYYKDWAGEKGQVMDGPHMIMIPLDGARRPTGEAYGCAMDEFEATYVKLKSMPDVYRKAATIRAYRPGREFRFRTVLEDGTVEVADGQGAETDWIVQNPSGEVYRIDNETFRSTYVQVGG
jgi:hypothetical protein